MSQKIMVVGGAGYIGSQLVPKLQNRGYDVTVVDLLWFGNHLPEGTKVIEKNAADLGENDLLGFDQVIFLGGLSNDPMAEFSPARNFLENGAIPGYLAFVAKQAGVKRFIYGGTCSVYGYTVNELYDETKPASSKYPYGISKLIGEFSVMQMNDPSFSTICLRQGTVSGFSPRMRFDLVVNTMFKSAMSNGQITVNNPAIWRPILAIQDAVAAYTRCVEAPHEISGVFNVASGNFTIGEIADFVSTGIEKRTGKSVPLEVKNIQDFRNYKVSTEKASNILSFKPSCTIDTIIEELFDNMEYFGDFSNPEFYNIQTFRKIEEGETV